MKEILKLLEKDGRLSAEELAAMVGRPLKEVKEAVVRAEREGAILKYKAVVNWEKAGDEQIMALLEVRITPQREVGFDAIARRIARFPETRSVYLVSGGHDLAVVVVGKSMQEVATFVSRKLAPLEGVLGTVTHFLLKRYKEDGELLEGEEEAHRQPLVL